MTKNYYIPCPHRRILKIFSVALLLIFLIGCNDNNDLAKNSVNEFHNKIIDLTSAADQTWMETEELISVIEKGELSKKEGASELKLHKVKITAITDEIYKLEVPSSLPENVRDSISKFKDVLASAYFEKAKAAGYTSFYYETGDKKYLQEITNRANHFEEEIVEAKALWSQIEEDVGIE